jgi:two-component system, NarL family, response regulator DegU
MPDHLPVTILIADDHPVFRKGLREVIEVEPDFRIVAEAGDGEEALACIERDQPRIAILDLDMPRRNGIEVAREVRRRKLATTLLVLTMFDEEDLFQQALEHGIMGYILKDSAVTDIIRGIRKVASGEYFLSPSLSNTALRTSIASGAYREQHAGLQQLTATERTVLRHIALGRSSKEIAAVLGISEKTVDNHRSHICAKLGISGSFSLVRFALEHRGTL